MRLLKNKKGIATSLIVDFWALVAYFLVFIIVYVSIIASSKLGYDICVEQVKEDRTMQLIDILRTPIDVNSDKDTVAGYIATYVDDSSMKEGDFKSEIMKSLHSFKVFENFYCFSIESNAKGSTILSEATLPKIGTCEVGGSFIPVLGPGGSVKTAEITFPAKSGETVTVSAYDWVTSDKTC